MSKEDNNLLGLFANFIGKENLQNLIKDKRIINFASQMSSQLINCDLLNQILDSNPNITNQLITQQIYLFKKDHPNSNIIIDKYLQSYQQKHSDENVYNIRQFLKSGHCKEALDDHQVQQYLSEALESPKFKNSYQKISNISSNHFIFLLLYQYFSLDSNHNLIEKVIFHFREFLNNFVSRESFQLLIDSKEIVCSII
jgi:hypothetical protein